ncbi:pyridoxamine 5'-phosphate oxidase family protein [Lacticaseibacillus absianus]|uniref:pyridoxamine 5'-phosphate oxidase family protein n=1 Tax=Lacticaseibacillus absianus TaxID=2729623 RepID=UPI0015C933F9|nr:pyridoxamine 5'-phosphate oxidase family protein [Lacticaseibacillus absianus]
MNEKFLEVLQHEGPVTIVTVNAHPASVVSTWMSYVTVQDGKLLIPAAGMHSIEGDLPTDDQLVVTFGSKAVIGTVGPGAGFYVYGTGAFIDQGPDFDAKQAEFPWVTRVLVVTIDKIEQKI